MKNTKRKAFIYIILLFAFILTAVPVKVSADYGIDEYGLPIRNYSASLPSWYPEDVYEFVEFHDSSIPRVVDKADIFTQDKEAEIAEKIAEISKKIEKDLVVVTDMSDYGLGHETYCYDFYDFNGYGFGDDYDGLCLYICMDPENRGWWTGATGYNTRSLYTEEYANQLDDALYEYMVDRQYALGVLDWLDNVYTLYTKGMPFAPDWYPSPEEKNTYVRTHNADAPRVNDAIKGVGAFTDEQEKELEKKAKEIANKYGVDVVIHTTMSDYNLGYERYIGDYYYYNGYGLGDDYNVALFCIYDDFNKIYIDFYGKIKDEFDEVNYNRMIDHCREAGSYYEAAEIFLDNLEHWERTGRVPRNLGQWTFTAIISIVVGLIIGRFFLSSAKKKMVTVRSAYGAENYVVSSSDFRTGTDIFIKRDIQRTKIPRYTSSSGSSSRSSSSGRSTYHSSSRGSSGRSHSGSGRRF